MTWHLSCHTILPSARYGPAIMTSFLSPGPKSTSGTMLVVPLSLSTLAHIIKQLGSSYHSNLNSNVFSPERSFLSIQSKRELLIPSTSLFYHMTLFIFLLVPFIIWNYVVYTSVFDCFLSISTKMQTPRGQHCLQICLSISTTYNLAHSKFSPHISTRI